MKREQLDFFHEQDPIQKELYLRAKFKVGILGGKGGRDQACKLGHDLTKEFYTIQTGGYNAGTMEGGLSGANDAIEEMRENNKTRELLDKVYPFPKGITMEKSAGKFPEAQGKNIKIEEVEGKGGKYQAEHRLGELVEDSAACIILPGDTGTKTEIYDAMHFHQNVQMKLKLKTKPLIFVGDSHNEILQKDFKEIVDKSDSVYEVKTEEEAINLVKILQNLQDASALKLTEDRIKGLEEERKKYLLRFGDEKSA